MSKGCPNCRQNEDDFRGDISHRLKISSPHLLEYALNRMCKPCWRRFQMFIRTYVGVPFDE